MAHREIDCILNGYIFLQAKNRANKHSFLYEIRLVLHAFITTLHYGYFFLSGAIS